MSDPTNPVILGDEGVLELGVVVSPLLAAGELGVCLISEEKGIFHFFPPHVFLAWKVYIDCSSTQKISSIPYPLRIGGM